MTNPRALPRAFVPSRVETEIDDAVRLAKLGASDFDPSQVAFAEQPTDLPQGCIGSAEIVDQAPTHLIVTAHMETPGMIVISDLYDAGWQAWLGGKRVDILRTNHALRGVIVPAGESVIDFYYRPASVAWGWRLSAVACVGVALWFGFSRRMLRITSL